MALAGQVHSWLAMVEVHSLLVMGVVRSWMQSRNVHHCRALSTLEWVGRTADAVVLERVELRCTQRGEMFILAAPLTRGTRPARLSSSLMLLSPLMGQPAPVLLLSGRALPAGPRVGLLLAWSSLLLLAVDIAAAAAAVQVTVAAGVAAMQAAGVAAMQVSVAAAMGVTAAAAMGVTAAAARGLTAAAAMWLTAAAAAVVHRDHRLGACPSACLSACLVHGHHLQSPLRRCPYRQRLAHVGKRPS